MSQEIKKLQPQAVWSYFYDLTQIPRPTGHVEQVIEYVQNFGKKLGLETHRDEVGNVVIRKPATAGLENRPIVTLQAHLDMVPQKNKEIKHDFLKDPIDAYIDGDYVRARGTTLGADNGIGAAMIMAVLADKSLKHGPLEGLFTIDEEVGMVGAFGLKEGFLKGDMLLNLDSELEGDLYIGCAGGIDINATLEYKEQETPFAENKAYLISLEGLKGGHSGVDIHLGRGNANKLLVRFLKKATEETDLRIAKIDGGSLRNAIPREASAIVTLPADETQAFEQLVAEYETMYNVEYAGIENKITLKAEPHALPKHIVPEEISDAVLNAIEACQNGVISMLSDFPDTVEASSNMAHIALGDGHFEALFLTRSSSESRKMMVASSIESAFALIGAKVEMEGSYSGWQPDAKSHVMKVLKECYKKTFGVETSIKVMHAGLECGIIKGVMPNMEMISFGPTILHPHSPDEKVDIATVEKTYKYLTAALPEF